VGSSTIDPGLEENAARLSEIVSLLEKIGNDSTLQLAGVAFSGSASPDGRADLNRRLAAERMSALENYVRAKVSIPDSIVSMRPDGIAWELLAGLVGASDMPHKEDALLVMRCTPEAVHDRRGRLIDSRKKQLMELQGGRTWHYMDEHFFALLRNAATVVVTVGKAEPRAENRESLPDMPDVSDMSNSSDTSSPRPFYMSVKTNLLYDALALPNIGVEFYLGKGWSITANWAYGWWDSDRRHRYWRAYGGDLAMRKWFGPAAGEKPLTGHHVGVYGQILTYDFEFGGKGQMAGRPGKPLWSEPSYAAGLEYGYSLPITGRLDIDFTIGVGYLGGKYFKYKPVEGHYVWQGTARRHWFGPTKAEISLVWLIGRGNRNERKGGGQ